VRKNDEQPLQHPQSHLVCYTITDSQPFQPLSVQERNQFGVGSLKVRRPETLCLPSFKDVIG
jgi:hypothetical protein